MLNFNLNEIIFLNIGNIPVRVLGRAEYTEDQPRYLIEFCNQKAGFPETKWIMQSQLHNRIRPTINLNHC